MIHRGKTANILALCLLIVVGCSADEDPGPTQEGIPEPTGADECPPSSELSRKPGDSPPQDPPAETCDPGPDEETDILETDKASLVAGPHGAVEIDLEITNNHDLSRAIILPGSVYPRVDEVQGVRRLSFLRVNMTLTDPPATGELGESRVNIEDPGRPRAIYIAAGETLSHTETIPVDAELLAEQMRICAEVVPETHPDAPGAQKGTGDTSTIIARGFGPDRDPVPLTCSEVFEVE